MSPRPGVALSDDERFAALLGDAVNALEAFQTPQPHPALEDVIGTLRFVRDSLEKRLNPPKKWGAR
jgi:hypothetical protein